MFLFYKVYFRFTLNLLNFAVSLKYLRFFQHQFVSPVVLHETVSIFKQNPNT